MAGLLVLIGGLASCAEPPPAEQQIRTNLEEMAQAIRDKQSKDVLAHLSADFTAQQSLHAPNIQGLMLLHFRRHQKIGLYLNKIEIKVQKAGLAEASALVVVTGAEQLLPQEGRVFQVNSTWRQLDGEWKLARLEWKDAVLEVLEDWQAR